MTTQAFLGNSATPHVIEHAGRTYRIGRLDQAAMDAVSAWAIRRARRAAVALYGDDPAALRERLEKLEADVADGAFEFLEDLISGPPTPERPKGGLLFTPAGTLALLSALCGCGEVDLLGLLAARREEVHHLLRLSLAESLPGFAAPNAPAAQAASSPS